MMRPGILFWVAAAAMALLPGCANNGGTLNAAPPALAVSPLVGKWSGKSDVKGGDLAKALNGLAGGPLTGPSYLTLNADGNGFLKVADKPERPISWKQEGDKVMLETRRAFKDDTSEKGGPWVGTLSPDQKSMTIDMEEVKLTLARSSP